MLWQTMKISKFYKKPNNRATCNNGCPSDTHYTLADPVTAEIPFSRPLVRKRIMGCASWMVE